MSILICPVCGEKLNKTGNSLKCTANHSFDFSKEGYVNLLLGSKNGDKTGDSKESARARHTLLAKGYYNCLKNYLKEKMHGTVLDICCGEGYYDDYDGELYGFDISKEMIRLASKSKKENNYFVANLSSIPIESESVDTALHLFAPFNEKEFSRILKTDGTLYSVVGGENHLWEMKELIYDTPYKNDEEPPKTEKLRLMSKTKITDKVKIPKEDLKTLFSMTPYFYRTSENNKAKLDHVTELELTVEFIVFEYNI
ncbi:MAG: methyltransferase domain-containing protein [Eubacterium sp.]|nr:methyltransferase domain-containing protein [Eubacterium sp.]